MEAVTKKQVGGDHYKKKKIQPWDIIDEYDLNFYEGNALKYLLRTKSDRLEDLKKCLHYIEKEIVNESTTSPEKSRGESTPEVEEISYSDLIRGTQIREIDQLLRAIEGVQTDSNSDAEAGSERCKDAGVSRGCKSDDHELSPGKESTEAGVGSDHTGRVSQMDRRVSETIDTLAGLENYLGELRYRVFVGDINPRDVCESLPHSVAEYIQSLEKISNI